MGAKWAPKVGAGRAARPDTGCGSEPERCAGGAPGAAGIWAGAICNWAEGASWLVSNNIICISGLNDVDWPIHVRGDGDDDGAASDDSARPLAD